MKRFIKTLAAIVATTIVFATCSNIMDDLKVRPASQPEPTTTPTPVPEQTPTPTPAPTPAPEPSALATPLTLEAVEAGAVVTFSNKAAGPVTYKVNGGAAQTIAKNSTGTITLEKVGDKVEFFGDNKAYATDSWSNHSNIACDKDCYVYGNIMSLVKSDGFENATALEKNCTFAYLFTNNAHIKNKKGASLLLPATSLEIQCYDSMFSGCTSLTTAPSLPATSLAEGCYRYMFFGCKKLTGAPCLPATTLANYCYNGMFFGCTSLTAAPSLPATTLAEGCYGYMFTGCASLNSVTCLATDISASDCTSYWLNGVAASGTFTKAAGMTGWTTNSASGIPSGWTYNEDSPLAIPLTLEACVAGAVITFKNKAAGPVTYKVNGGTAHTIARDTTGTITLSAAGDKVEFFGDNKAYATSFSNCSNIACDKDCYVYGNIMSLVKSDGFENATALEKNCTFAYLFTNNAHIKNKKGASLLLPATTLANNCYQSMFYGCTSLTATPSLPASTLKDYCYNEMFYGCTSLTAAPELKATTLADGCYSCMFQGCSSLTAAPELKATTLADSCYSCMFQGCSSLTAAPSLPATTLAKKCYYYMFSGCANLTTAPSLPAATLKEYCYECMFSGCSKLSNVTCLATDISAEGCTFEWLSGVAATGTFTKSASMNNWPTDTPSGIPNGWTVVDKQ